MRLSSRAGQQQPVLQLERNRRKMARLGLNLNRKKLWTEEELDVVRSFSNEPLILNQRLPHRTPKAIAHKRLIMGLTKTLHLWTPAEVSRLRKLYGTAPAEELYAAFPDRPREIVRQSAQYRGFRRPRKPYKIVGIDIVDTIRRRCFECRLTMSDLDAMAGSKFFFRCHGWKRALNYRYLASAIEALDGKIVVRWDEESGEPGE